MELHNPSDVGMKTQTFIDLYVSWWGKVSVGMLPEASIQRSLALIVPDSEVRLERVKSRE